LPVSLLLNDTLLQRDLSPAPYLKNTFFISTKAKNEPTVYQAQLFALSRELFEENLF